MIGEKKYVHIKEDRWVEMWVWYDIGATHYEASGASSRGIHILVRPIRKLESGGVESYVGKGFKYCMKKMGRQSHQTNRYAEAWLERHHQKIGELFRDKFLNKIDDSEMWAEIDTFGKEKI